MAHFRVESKLGEGGMGAVYRALDLHLNRPVAVKVLHNDAAADPQRRHRFVQEARAASALNHPNILTIHDINRTEVEGQALDFMVMEFIDGQTLDQLIGRNGLPVGEALKYAAHVADALACAHAAGIIHRDLKPSNIIVSGAGHVKVLDFGLAKLMEPETPIQEQTVTIKTVPHTEEGTILGTVAYMSPEQAEGKFVDARSDIFSFGSMLYEMVTGRRAFSGDSKLSILSAILQKEPEGLKGLPPDIKTLITRCLRKDPARRIQSMGDVRLVLEDLQEDFASGKLRPLAARLRRGAALAALCALLLVAGGTWFLRRANYPATHEIDAPAPPVPLTSYQGNELQPSFSPDGNQVAFVWDGALKNSSIYIKLIGTDKPLRLTNGPGDDVSPAWSPDGRLIAFARLHDPGAPDAVYVVPAIGGPAKLVTELNAVPGVGPLFSYVTQLPHPLIAWAEDGKSLLFSDREARGQAFGIFAISLESGQRRRLTSAPPGIIGDGGPAVSPDGRTLVFSRALTYVSADLYRIQVTRDLRVTGAPERVTDLKQWTATPLWIPGSVDLLFSTSGLFQGPFHLWRLGAQTGDIPRPLAAYGEAGWPAYSPARARLVLSLENMDANIWRIPIRGAVPAGAPVKLIASTRSDVVPQYSPDGSKIAFISNRGGQNEVWISDSQGSNTIQLTSLHAALTGSPHWSPDGRTIAFDSTVNGHFQIFTVNAAGGAPRRLTDHASESAMPSYSRDGRFIYFASNQSGRFQIWKMRADGGDPVQITQGGGRSNPQESSDGKSIFYELAGRLWKCPTDGGVETQVAPSVGFMNSKVAEQGIYFITRANSDRITTVQYLGFSGAAPKTVFTIDKPVAVGLGISPDGTSLVYSQVDQHGSDLMLVENFH